MNSDNLSDGAVAAAASLLAQLHRGDVDYLLDRAFQGALGDADTGVDVWIALFIACVEHGRVDRLAREVLNAIRPEVGRIKVGDVHEWMDTLWNMRRDWADISWLVASEFVKLWASSDSAGRKCIAAVLRVAVQDVGADIDKSTAALNSVLIARRREIEVVCEEMYRQRAVALESCRGQSVRIRDRHGERWVPLAFLVQAGREPVRYEVPIAFEKLPGQSPLLVNVYVPGDSSGEQVDEMIERISRVSVLAGSSAPPRAMQLSVAVLKDWDRSQPRHSSLRARLDLLMHSIDRIAWAAEEILERSTEGQEVARCRVKFARTVVALLRLACGSVDPLIEGGTDWDVLEPNSYACALLEGVRSAGVTAMACGSSDASGGQIDWVELANDSGIWLHSVCGDSEGWESVPGISVAVTRLDNIERIDKDRSGRFGEVFMEVVLKAASSRWSGHVLNGRYVWRKDLEVTTWNLPWSDEVLRRLTVR